MGQNFKKSLTNLDGGILNQRVNMERTDIFIFRLFPQRNLVHFLIVLQVFCAFSIKVCSFSFYLYESISQKTDSYEFKKSYRPLLKKHRRPEKQSEYVPDSAQGQRSLVDYSVALLWTIVHSVAKSWT